MGSRGLSPVTRMTLQSPHGTAHGAHHLCGTALEHSRSACASSRTTPRNMMYTSAGEPKIGAQAQQATPAKLV